MKDFHDIFLIVLIIMQKVLTIYASHLNDYNLHDNSTSKLKPNSFSDYRINSDSQSSYQSRKSGNNFKIQNNIKSEQNSKKIFDPTDLVWIPEPTGEYALGCDWEHKRELGFLFNKKRSECGSLCLAHPDCTRYNWSPEQNGLCVLKDQIPSKFTVLAAFSPPKACGIVNRGNKQGSEK